MTKKPSKLFSDFSIDDHRFVRGDTYWNAETLIEASKGLTVFDLPTAGIDIGVWPWDEERTIRSFSDHLSRCLELDPKFPVILDEYGYICDGWHRLSTAIARGVKSIKAVRLVKMPEPDGHTKELDDEYTIAEYENESE